jgi:SAM-dependent methyltransferase
VRPERGSSGLATSGAPAPDNRQRWDAKHDAVKFWDENPCGAVPELGEGTPAFFAAVDEDRYRRYAPWLMEAMGCSRFEGQRILELGCGMATDLARFVAAGARAFAIDLTPRHLAIARQRMALENAPLRLVRADAEQLPFRGESVDVVYSFGVLHHTPDIAAAIAEAWRTLRPGGRLILGLYHRDSVFYWWTTMACRGLVLGGLLRRGYRAHLATIERGTVVAATPLVHVYSRRRVRELLRRFSDVSVKAYHLTLDEIIGRRVRTRLRIPPTRLDSLGRAVGWFLVAEGVKTRAARGRP